jgi:outer membrane protein
VIRGGWFLVVGGLAAAPGRAADAPPPAFSSLSLDAAVNVTLTRSPDILRARATMTSQEGALRNAKGAFDLVFNFNPSLKRQEGTLSADLTAHEGNRRLQLQDASIAFGQVRDEYAQAIQTQEFGVVPCPGGFTTITVNQNTANGSRSQILCVPLVTDTTTPTDPAALSNLVNSILLPPSPGAGVNTLNFDSQLAQILGLNVQQLSEDLRQRGLEVLEQGHSLAIEANEVAALDFNRLGGIPNLDDVKTAAVEMDLTKPFRFGTTLELQATFQGVEDGYPGKPLDPVFGGKEVQNLFTSNFSLILTQPLGQGRGAAATDSAERAAAANLEAARQQYQHQLSQSTLNTIDAYLNVAAAQDTVDLLEQSVAANRKILDGLRELFKKGEKARSDVDRVAARLADVEGSTEGARLSLLSARGSLATATGLKSEEVQVGPLVSQRLASASMDVDVASLANNATSLRRDLRAAEAQRDSAEILERAAAVNMRRRFDLSVTAGVSNAYYAPFFRVLKDEFVNDPTEQRESTVEYFNPRGIWRAWQKRWEPQLAVKLTFSVPFKNRTSEGKLVQAQATFHRSEIQAGNLARVINEQVTQQALVTQRARSEMEKVTESVKQHEVTWNATRQLFGSGDISLIDALVTEQDLTSARLNLVQARLAYTQALAQLRFQSGTLLKPGAGGAESANLDGLVEGRRAQ